MMCLLKSLTAHIDKGLGDYHTNMTNLDMFLILQGHLTTHMDEDLGGNHTNATNLDSSSILRVLSVV